MKPISVQLYSLREESQEDFDGVLERLAAIGYKGVEPFALFGKTPEAFKRQVEDLGMAISSTHHPWANRFEAQEVIDTVSALGLSRAAGGLFAGRLCRHGCGEAHCRHHQRPDRGAASRRH